MRGPRGAAGVPPRPDRRGPEPGRGRRPARRPPGRPRHPHGLQPARRTRDVPGRWAGRGGPAHRGGDTCPSSGAADRAGSGRPPRPRGQERPRGAAADVARAAGDLEATRGQHAHRGRVPRERRHQRSRGPVGRRLYSRVGVERRPLLRDLVLRLVSPGPEGEAVRTRVPRRLVGTDPEHEQLIEMLVTARLVTSDDGALEITHEALTRAWPRLRGWLDDDVEGQRIRHHLSAAADAWEALGRPDSELYRGVRLARALDWRADKDTALTEVEREFLEASSHHAEAEQQSIVERARAQARLIRRLRIVLGGAAVLLVLALVAGALAAVQSDRANENAAQAERDRRTTRQEQLAVSADARRVGARSQLTDDISLSLLLAAAGVRLDDSPETRANLVTALAKRPTLVRSAPPGGGYMEAFDVSRDGRWIASSDDQNRMHLYDASTSRLLRSYDAGEASAGYHLAGVQPRQQAARRGPARVGVHRAGAPAGPEHHEADDEARLPRRQAGVGGRCRSSAPTAATWPPPCTRPTGGRRSPTETPGYAVVWDLRSPSTPPIRVPTGTDAPAMALSPDGRILYTGWPLTAYDVATGKQIWRRKDVSVLGASRREHRGDSAGSRGPGRTVANAAPGECLHRGDGPHAARTPRPGPSTCGSRPTARWWGRSPTTVSSSSGTPPPAGRWNGGTPPLRGASASARTVTWSTRAAATRCCAPGTGRWRTRTCSGRPRSTTPSVFAHADISPDGQQVAYRWLDDTGTGWVRFVDTATGEATPPDARSRCSDVPGPCGTWHPEGRAVRRVRCCAATECGWRTCRRVLDSATGEVLDDTGARRRRRLLVAYVDGGPQPARGRRTKAGPTSWTPRPCFPRAMASTFATRSRHPDRGREHRDGPRVHGDGTSVHWRVIDVSTGDVRSEGDVDLAAYASVASPDGSTVAVAGDTGEIVTIDVSTGDEQRRSASLGAEVLWLDYSDDGELLVSGADGRRGQPVGRHDAGPAGHRVPTPPRRRRSRRARSSSATATTWPSRRTTARSTGGRPTSTGPSTSRARWPAGT